MYLVRDDLINNEINQILKKKKDVINNKKIIGPLRNFISLESKRAH